MLATLVERQVTCCALGDGTSGTQPSDYLEGPVVADRNCGTVRFSILYCGILPFLNPLSGIVPTT